MQQKSSNCWKPDSCALNGKCLTGSVVYMATVKASSGEQRKNIGLTENTLKSVYTHHLTSFRNQGHENSTELSKHI